MERTLSRVVSSSFQVFFKYWIYYKHVVRRFCGLMITSCEVKRH